MAAELALPRDASSCAESSGSPAPSNEALLLASGNSAHSKMRAIAETLAASGAPAMLRFCFGEGGPMGQDQAVRGTVPAGAAQEAPPSSRGATPPSLARCFAAASASVPTVAPSSARGQKAGVRRPSESGITEGNLAELPIWVLSNREAKRLAPGSPLDRVSLAEYTKVLRIGESSSVTIEASPKHGFPTMFAYRVLLVVLDLAQKGGFRSRLVGVTRYEIALRLGYRRPGRPVYEDIENALRALATIKFEFRDAWYQRAGDRGRRGALGFTGLVSGFQFESEEARPAGEAGAGHARSFVELGLHLHESLQARYLIGVDLDYLNRLRSPLAQRLYIYLTKHDKGPVHVEGLRSLGSKLGIAKNAPSAIKHALTPALAALGETPVVGEPGRARRFLASARFDDLKEQLVVTFFREGPAEGSAARAQTVQEKVGRVP